MRTTKRTTAVTAAVLGMLGALAGTGAGPGAAATVPVLTWGSPGGTPVNPGDQLSTQLNSGTPLRLTTTPGGPVGANCTSSVMQAQATANPPSPGTATATLTAWSIGACTSSNPGVVNVIGTVVNALPQPVVINDTGTLPVRIGPAGPGLTIVMTVNLGAGTMNCTYQPVGAVVTGNTVLGTSQWVFTNSKVQLVGGAVGPCGQPVDYLTAAYAPVRDTTIGSLPLVYVN